MLRYAEHFCLKNIDNFLIKVYYSLISNYFAFTKVDLVFLTKAYNNKNNKQ